MMLCNDLSGGLPSAAGVGAANNGQSQLSQIDAQPVGAKTRGDLLLDPSAVADHRLPVVVTRPSPSVGDSRPPKKTVTPSSQSDWHLNFVEGRSSRSIVENAANPPRSEISDAMSSRTEKVTVTQAPTDVVLVEPNSPAEARTMKRFANCVNSVNPSSHVAKKRMKMDAHPTMFSADQVVGHSNVLTQEHWKKGALGYLTRDVAPSSSESLSKDKAKVSKDSLSQHLNHIDSLIVQHEMALARLHTTLEQLEEAMPKSNEDSGNREKELEQLEAKPLLSEAEQLLAENKRKAEASHAFMTRVKSLTESFMYQRPSDTAVYHENKHKFMAFKKRLITFLKNKNEAQNTRMETLKKQYNSLHVDWRRKMETVENDQKPSSKKVQEYFDKIFPEMKKQEEEKLQRYCSRVSPSTESEGSNKDQKESANKPEIQMEMVMEKLRSLAAHPSPMLDANSRRLRFLNENSLIEEPAAVNSASMLKCSFWTEQERDIFIEKYVRHPKKFGLIASCLESKNIHDCVQFYYLTKKAVGYKKLQRQKYSRKPKMRGANNAKEDKAENKNSGVHPCRERNPLPGSVPTSAAVPERKNQSELEPAEEPSSLAISTGTDVVVERVADNGSSSLPVEPSPSAIPPESSLVSLNPPPPPPSPDEEKKNRFADLVEAVTPPLTTCDDRAAGSATDKLDSVAKSHTLQSPLKELQELVQDSGKADDNDSVATLSADEGAAHSQDDDEENCNPPEEDAPPPPTLLPSFPAQVSTVTEQTEQSTEKRILDATRPLSCRGDDLNPDGYLSCLPLRRDTEAAVLQKSQPSAGKDGGRHERVSMATASPLLASEMRGFVRPAGEFDDRSKRIPDLLPLGLEARAASSPQVYSPPAGNQSGSDGRVVLPVAGMSSFVRNSGSPARIRDLIHAAIKKTLQVPERKPSEAEVNAKRHAEAKKFEPPNDVAYRRTAAACASVGENEAEDLSVRHASSRHVSSAAEASGKVLQPKNVPCQPRNVDSPYHLRPAHSNPPATQPDPRSGYLLELAIVAEYENMKRSEREQQVDAFERNARKDATSMGGRDVRRETFGLEPRREPPFERDLHSGRYDFTMAAVDPADQMLRRREASLHRGSIMQGTPIPTSQFHAPAFPAEAMVEHFGVPPPSSAGRNPAMLPDPSTRGGSFHPTVPHISSDHMKLLRDDFRTAQQLRSMQQAAPPGVEPIDRNFKPYRSYPGVTHAPASGQNDARMESLYQPSRVGAFPGGIPNNLSVPPPWQQQQQQQQHPAVRLSESYAAGGSGQRTLTSGRSETEHGNHVMAMRNSPFETTRGGYMPDKRTSDGLAPSQWPIPLTVPPSVRGAKGPPNLAEQKNWPKISDGCSAAQLIEWIISIQISQPDNNDKGIPPSILSRIEETNAPPPLPESLDPWSMPPNFRARHDDLRMARDMMSTAPRPMAMPERSATSGSRMSERISQPPAAVSESGSSSSRPEFPDRGFPSGAGISDRVMSSLMDVPNRTYLSGMHGGVSDHGADRRDARQSTRVTTVENCVENIFRDMSRETNSQGSNDANRLAMRTFLTDSSSDQTSSYEDVHQTDVVPRVINRRLINTDLNHQTRVSSPWLSASARREGSSSSSDHPPDKVPGVRRADSEADDPGRSIEGAGFQDHSVGKRSAGGGFNWKTKILREHQKQQREKDDRDSPFLASPSPKSGSSHEKKLNERQQLRRLSSSDLSTQSIGDTASAVGRADGATAPLSSCTASGLSSPVEGSRSLLGGVGVGAVQDDQESPIAGKHQMISTLLSSRSSGRQPGRSMPMSASSASSSSPSSAAAASSAGGPVPSDSQLSKQTVARDSTFYNQSDKTDPSSSSPAPCGSESPGSDSPGLNLPGRLCIHLDSTEGLRSPSPSS